MKYILGEPDLEEFRETIFVLSYRSGGTGLGYSYSEIMEMNIADKNWFVERLGEQFKKEKRAAKIR